MAAYKKPYTLGELRDQFRNYSREPFTDILARMIHCAPTDEAMQTFAELHPDKWASALKNLSQLAGYHEKLEITGNIHLEIQSIGDSQLIKKLTEIQDKLEALDDKEREKEESPLIELSPIDVPTREVARE